MTVTVWMCPCGTEYKALSERDPLGPLKSSVACPKCQAIGDVDGVVKEQLALAPEGHWRTVWAKTVANQHRRVQIPSLSHQ